MVASVLACWSSSDEFVPHEDGFENVTCALRQTYQNIVMESKSPISHLV